MSDERIEALERVVAQLADALVTNTATITAQAVIVRAVVDLVGRAGLSLDDVRDHALAITAGMPGEVDTAVRTVLAEAPAGAEVLQ